MHEAYCMSKCATLSELASQIVMRHLHRIFIVNENDKLVGIVTRGDILRVTMAKYRSLFFLTFLHSHIFKLLLLEK